MLKGVSDMNWISVKDRLPEKIAHGVLKAYHAYTCMTLAICNYWIDRARWLFEDLKLQFDRLKNVRR